VCTACNTYFTLSDDTHSCTPPVSCPLSGQVFDGITCICPAGLYDNGSGCSACSSNCLSCTTGSLCQSCAPRFFVSSGSCSVCSDNCIECSSASVCTSCLAGFSIVSNACVSSPSTNIATADLGGVMTLCPIGCATCTSATVCTTCLAGFAFQSNACVQCDKSCLTCSTSDPTECLSCTSSQNLYSGRCLSCSDTNCVNCKNNNEFCLKCKPGYTSVDGVCTACTTNCLQCDTAGAGLCDIGKCAVGFTRIRLDSCAQCLLGCSSCLSTNITTCLSCPAGTYAASSSLCILCATGCSACSSGSVCTQCSKGYELSGNTCVQSCSFPCATCNADLTCLTCYGGYSLSSGACVSSVACSADNSCTDCPLGYSLNTNICVQCTASNCQRCNPSTPSQCKLCSSTTYLDTTALTCIACTTPCLSCLNSDICTTCANGYLMQMNDNTPSGKCIACDSNCATCSETPTYCTSCPTGYSLTALKCISNQNIGFNITFSSPTAASSAAEISAFMIILEEIRQSLAGLMGAPYNTNPNLISFSSLTSGSVIVGGKMSTTSGSDPTAVLSSASSNIVGNGFSGFQVQSTAFVANGFNPSSSSSSSVNLPLILGLSIPLGVIFIIVVAVIIVKIKAKNNDIREVAKIEEVVANPSQPLEN